MIQSLILGAALVLTAEGARAETGFDLVFRTGTLDGFEEGDSLLYRNTEEPEGDWSRLAVALIAGDGAVVQGLTDEGAVRPLGRFPAGVGNPIAMVFLERTVRIIAERSGGSPFYIRNRMRDALALPDAGDPATVEWNGAPVAATVVTLEPFRTDPNRDRLGVFADLTIRIVLSDAVPGWYHSLEARTPAGADGAYEASLRLEEVES